MCPGVESDKPGDCPKCGMALERNPAWVAPASGKVIYTCPMHPEVQQDHPGDCPKCGMPLEPMTATPATDEEENAELRDMTRRFWIGAALTLPVFVLAMAHMVPALAAQSLGRQSHLALDSIRAHDARRRLGRLAVLPPRLAIAADGALEHVHADRHRRGRGVRLSARWRCSLPASFPTRCNTAARSASTLKRRP